MGKRGQHPMEMMLERTRERQGAGTGHSMDAPLQPPFLHLWVWVPVPWWWLLLYAL